MRRELLDQLEVYERRARDLSGWVLEYEPERLDPSPPWDYEERARELARDARLLLDLGTGGGEVLSRVLAGIPVRALATEQWHVNAPVAARSLAIPVVRASSLAIPFASRSFDLVLSRHEEIDPNEVARVLRLRGRFLTQQIGGDFWPEMREWFPIILEGWTLDSVNAA